MKNKEINGFKEHIILVIENMNRVMSELYSVEYAEPFVRKIYWFDQSSSKADVIRSILIGYMNTRSIDRDAMSYFMYLTRDRELQTWIENKLSKCEHPFTSDAEYLNKILSACNDDWEDKDMYPLLMAEEELIHLKNL